MKVGERVTKSDTPPVLFGFRSNWRGKLILQRFRRASEAPYDSLQPSCPGYWEDADALDLKDYYGQRGL